MKIVIILLGIGASIIAYLDYLEWVVLATATAAAVTSWVEFSDAARKTERYTRALYSLRKLLAWWASLGQVEKASRGAITHLVTTSEAIISDERLAWMSTSRTSKSSALAEGAEEGAAGSNEGGDANSRAGVGVSNTRIGRSQVGPA